MSFITFPKIRHVHDFLHYVKEHEDSVESRLTLIPSVKLHGSNLSIVWRKDGSDLQIQSRNNIIDLKSDMMGAVSFIHQRREHFDLLIQAIEDFYKDKVKLDTIVVANEYCGGNIQANVALNQVPKMMVVTAIKLNHYWISYDDMKLIFAACPFSSLNNNQIYHIFQITLPSVVIDVNKPSDAVTALNDMTMEIDKECPFVFTLFGKRGTGEGIVCRAQGHEQNPEMWFKMKGETHCESKPKSAHRLTDEQKEALRTVRGFAEGVVTTARLEQGIRYLKESKNSSSDVALTKSLIPEFVKWVNQDVLSEHKLEIKELGLNEKQVTKEVSALASKYFLSIFNKL